MTDEDCEVDLDDVMSNEENEDSLEYRSETEVSQDSQEDLVVDELEIRKITEESEERKQESEEKSSSEDSQDETEECNTPACSKVKHTDVAEAEEVEIATISDDEEDDFVSDVKYCSLLNMWGPVRTYCAGYERTG